MYKTPEQHREIIKTHLGKAEAGRHILTSLQNVDALWLDSRTFNLCKATLGTRCSDSDAAKYLYVLKQISPVLTGNDEEVAARVLEQLQEVILISEIERGRDEILHDLYKEYKAKLQNSNDFKMLLMEVERFTE